MRQLLIMTAAFALLLAGTAAAADADHVYVGAKKCKSCHKKEAIGDQWNKWLESKHAKAYETLAGEDAKKIATEKGIADPQKADECLKCHTTAHGVDAAMVDKKFDPTMGVQCEACHGPGKDYRKKKVMKDRDMAISKGLIIPDEETCTGCHNSDSPTFESFDFEKAKEDIAHPVPEGYDSSGEADDEEE